MIEADKISINSYVWIINRPIDAVPHVLQTSVRRIVRYIGGGDRYILDGLEDIYFTNDDLYPYNEYQLALDTLNHIIEEEAKKENSEPPDVRMWYHKNAIDYIENSAEEILKMKVEIDGDYEDMLKTALQECRVCATNILRTLRDI